MVLIDLEEAIAFGNAEDSKDELWTYLFLKESDYLRLMKTVRMQGELWYIQRAGEHDMPRRGAYR